MGTSRGADGGDTASGRTQQQGRGLAHSLVEQVAGVVKHVAGTVDNVGAETQGLGQARVHAFFDPALLGGQVLGFQLCPALAGQGFFSLPDVGHPAIQGSVALRGTSKQAVGTLIQDPVQASGLQSQAHHVSYQIIGGQRHAIGTQRGIRGFGQGLHAHGRQAGGDLVDEAGHGQRTVPGLFVSAPGGLASLLQFPLLVSGPTLEDVLDWIARGDWRTGLGEGVLLALGCQLDQQALVAHGLVSRKRREGVLGPFPS